MVKIYDNGDYQHHQNELDVPVILNDFNTNTNLKRIYIRDSIITPNQCTELSRIFNVPNIKSFYIMNTPLGDDVRVKNLFGNNNFKSSKLEIFELEGYCELTRTGLNIIVNYLPKMLDLLILECNDITPDDIDGIVNNIANGQRLLGSVYLYSNGKRYHRQYSNEGVLGSILLDSYDEDISPKHYENLNKRFVSSSD
jgi:hypothetical protein